MTDILELLGGEAEPEPVSGPDLAFRLRVQHEVEDEILEMYLQAHPASKLKLPPRAEIVDGQVDRAALTARWNEVRALGRKVSDERVTELLELGGRRIDAHEGRVSS
jgi:hypothetical protein